MADPNFTDLTADMIRPLTDDSFQPFPLTDALEYRDLGVAEATGGVLAVGVFRAKPGSKTGTGWHTHDLTFHLAYVLKGWALFEFEGVGEVRLEAGMAIHQPAWNKHREIDSSPDFEVMEITLPAEFETTGYRRDAKTGETTAIPVKVLA